MVKLENAVNLPLWIFRPQIFFKFALPNNHYQISKNEGNQNFKLSKLPKTAWILQKLAPNNVLGFSII